MDDTCTRCMDSFEDKETATPNICDHLFCLSCLQKWIREGGSFCPVDRQRFNKIVTKTGTKVVKPRKKTRRKRRRDVYDITTHCDICDDVEDGMILIMCDCCDLGYHLDCLDPPLMELPPGQWNCKSCCEIEERLRSGDAFSPKKKVPNNLESFTPQSPSSSCSVSPFSRMQNPSMDACQDKAMSLRPRRFHDPVRERKSARIKLLERHDYSKMVGDSDSESESDYNAASTSSGCEEKPRNPELPQFSDFDPPKIANASMQPIISVERLSQNYINTATSEHNQQHPGHSAEKASKPIKFKLQVSLEKLSPNYINAATSKLNICSQATASRNNMFAPNISSTCSSGPEFTARDTCQRVMRSHSRGASSSDIQAKRHSMRLKLRQMENLRKDLKMIEALSWHSSRHKMRARSGRNRK